jgi:hypothetical protein
MQDKAGKRRFSLPVARMPAGGRGHGVHEHQAVEQGRADLGLLWLAWCETTPFLRCCFLMKNQLLAKTGSGGESSVETRGPFVFRRFVGNIYMLMIYGFMEPSGRAGAETACHNAV